MIKLDIDSLLLGNFAPKLSASFCSVLPHQHYCSFWLLDFDTIHLKNSAQSAVLWTLWILRGKYSKLAISIG